MNNGLPVGINGFVRGQMMAREANERSAMRDLGMLQTLLALQETAETQPLRRQQLQGQIAQQEQDRALMNAWLQARGGPGVLSGQPQPTAGILAGNSGTPPEAAGPAAMGAPMLPSGGVLSGQRLPPDVALGLVIPRLAPWAKEEAKMFTPTDRMREAAALGFAPGSAAYNAHIGDVATQGGIFRTDPSGNRVVAPGFAEGRGAIERQEQQARAEFDLVSVPDGRGGTIQMTRQQAIQALGPNAAPQTPRTAVAAPGPIPGAPRLTDIPYVPPAQQRRIAGNLDAGLRPDGSGPAIPSSAVLDPGLGLGRTPAASVTAANTEASREFIAEMRQNYSKLRDSAATLQNIDAAKAAIPEARTFMGPLGEQKLQAAKFFRNALGVNIDTEGVKSAEELRSRVFMQIMDNLKKMDAQPSTYQQKVMQDALGTLGTDPAALPRVLDVFGDIIREKVGTHNRTVDDAIAGGTRFPYNVRIALPDPSPAAAIADANRGGTAPRSNIVTPNRGGNIVNFSDLRR